VVGVVGGLHGIGGGSVLGPLLVGAGMSVGTVTPAALAPTPVTSVVGVAAAAPEDALRRLLGPVAVAATYLVQAAGRLG
jgi:uncharacterized membrane protein YfcA